MPDFHIDKNTYATDPRFQALRDAGVSFEDFSYNQNYYMQTLSRSSIMDLYNKGKSIYEKYTTLYNEQMSLFTQLRNERDKKYNKYEQLLAIYANKNKNGEPSNADRNTAALYSGYTTDLVRSVTDAEILADVYLDGRQSGVDMQRRGLMG